MSEVVKVGAGKEESKTETFKIVSKEGTTTYKTGQPPKTITIVGGK